MKYPASSDLFMEELIKIFYSCYYDIIIFVFGNSKKKLQNIYENGYLLN